MAKTFHLDIIASDKYFYNGDCEHVIFPGLDGFYGILPGHQPMVSCLVEGELKYQVDGEWHTVIVSQGFLEITADQVTILSETVEKPEDIDRKRAEQAKDRAEEKLRQKQSIVEYYKNQAALNRALARLKATAPKHNI
ncbi:MAG: F0F1 ATP synthase subunit epsilon [Oscillospiraceae bacterium]